MTSNELLKCLKDRPCSVCKFRDENGCHKWTCVFEQPTDDEDIAKAYHEGYVDGQKMLLEHIGADMIRPMIVTSGKDERKEN